MASLSHSYTGIPRLDSLTQATVDDLYVDGTLALSSPITAYSTSDVSPGTGQIGDTYTYNTTSAKTLTGSLQQIMGFTFDRGVGVWLLTGHYRLNTASATKSCVVTTTLVVGSNSHFYYTYIPENTLGAQSTHTINFSYVFTVTSTDPFSVAVNAVFGVSPVSGTVSTGSSSDVRYSAIQLVRVA